MASLLSTLTPNKRQRDGVVGLGMATAFLLFATTFNERIQAYKASRQGNPQLNSTNDSVVQAIRSIVSKACGWREAITVGKLSLMLVLRTAGSVWVSKHWGCIVNALVKRNFPRVKMLVLQFAGATVSLAFLNAFLKYYIAALRLNLRERITHWCHDKYMRPKEMVFYKANKVGEDKIENCDHLITSDVDRFADAASDILSQSLKPVIDFLVYSFELSCVQGLMTPLTLYAWFVFAACASSVSLPPFGELAAVEQLLEGRFRSAHSTLIANCEQIAFLGGEGPEKKVLDQELGSLMDHCRRSINLSFNSEVLRQYLNKYFVTVIGFFLIARPVRLGLNDMGTYTADQIAQYFTSTWRSMELMATSIQDLFELTNRIGRLSGFASRVHRLMCGLEERPPVLEKHMAEARCPPKFKHGDHLKFENVSVYRPDGALLVKNLNLTVPRGHRVLITGGNGCGKSSLFRVIRKLWPLVEGTITMPADDEIYFLSQVNFVPLGTLRDLVTYPHVGRKAMQAYGTDKDVLSCLEWAHVSPQVGADGRAELEFTDASGETIRPDLDDIRDWQKDLSPGQKQRVAFARLFFHRPSFVVLDECTNGISPDVEHDLYDRLSNLQIAVFSISHKIELKLFHDRELHYFGDAEGSWVETACVQTTGSVRRSSHTTRSRSMLDLTAKPRLLLERHMP